MKSTLSSTRSVANVDQVPPQLARRVGADRAAQRRRDAPPTPILRPAPAPGADDLDHRLSLVLRDFAHTMGTDFPIQSILDHLVGQIVAVLPVTAAGVTLIAPGSDPRDIAASNEAALRFEQLQSELDEGPCLLAYRSGDAVSVADLEAEDRFPRFAPRALAAGLRAVFTFPLRHGQQPLGALDLYRDTPGPLSPAELDAAQTLADVAAAYLLNAQARLDLQQAGERSREQALHDALTGLPNRTLILDRLEHALLRSRRSSKFCAVLFIDLDRLKAVNDTHGHAVGDELLVAAARRLAALIRPGDTLGRLSGDEFVVLCQDLQDLQQSSVVAGRLLAALSRPFALSVTRVDITASIGIAHTRGGDRCAEELLDDADSAMYQAKRSGGNRHQVFDAQLKHVTDHHSALERDLQGAAGRGELHTAYQPIVSTSGGQVTGFEALVRWNHPGHGPIAPATLIPLAEQSGLIDQLGTWVLQRACTDLHRWQRFDVAPPLGVAVNVSAHQLMSPGYLDTVADVLDSTRAEPRHLTREVTESVFLDNEIRALSVLTALRELGVTLALDDFGTGYAALNYLQKYPVDVLKVDRSFVADLGREPAAAGIIRAIVQLAHGLGMTVVAEGVETAAQHRAVSDLGCHSSQGFYFAEPMTAQAITDLMSHGPTHLPRDSSRRPGFDLLR